MARWMGRFPWLMFVVSMVVILTVSLGLLIPRLIPLESLKDRVVAKLCEYAECRFDYDQAEFFLLPAPHVVVSQVRIAVPGRLSGTVRSLSLFPRVLPLFSGRIEVAKLRFSSPDLDITLNQDPTPAEERQPEVFPAPYSGAGMQRAVKRFAEQLGEVHLQVEQGGLRIQEEARSLLSLTGLSADIALLRENLTVEAECRSDLWERLKLKGSFAPGESKGKGRMILDRLRAQTLARYLPPDAPKPTGDSPISLDLSFSSEGPETFSATVKCFSPALTLRMGDEEAGFKDPVLTGTIRATAGRFEIREARLTMEDPRLTLSGRFLSDTRSSEVSYHLECTDTDAGSVREAALALAGKIEVVQDVFQVLRGGWVPLATFDGHAASTEGLQRTESLLVCGSLRDGGISIPKVDLSVNAANGDVLISKGILEGRNLRGQAAASTGRNGSLTVALGDNEGPFHLDIEIDADLVQLPPVLARAVSDQAFLRELDLVQIIEGRANGRLVLDNSSGETQTAVEVNEWDLKGSYQRFPFSLKLDGGCLLYKGPTLSVRSLNGHIGQSKVNNVSGSFDWSRGPVLDLASSNTSRVLVDELFPWLKTLPGTMKRLPNIRALTGTLWVDSFAFKGDLTRPDSWEFLLNGRTKDLVVDSDRLPDTLRIKSGAFVASPETLQIVDFDLSCADATLTASGKIIEPVFDPKSLDFSFHGTIGPEAGDWVADLIHMPTDLRVRHPVSTQAMRLTWNRNAPVRVSGSCNLAGGPELSIELERGPEELCAKRLTITDEESNAVLALCISSDAIEFGFKGDLGAETIKRLFHKDLRLSGSLEGDVSGRIASSHLAGLTADGTLTVRDLCYTPARGVPVRVESAVMDAKGDILQVKTAAIRLQETPYDLKGNVVLTGGELQLDLDLSASDIDWDSLRSSLASWETETDDREKTATSGESFLGMPVRGTVRVHAGQFTSGDTTWKPFQARLTFTPNGLGAEVTDARLCSIPTPARIIPSDEGRLLILNLNARDLDLDPALSCLWDRRVVVTGTFDLKGELSATLDQGKMSQTLQGSLELLARDGRVYHSTLLIRIFSLLSVADIFRGKLPDLVKEGCAYSSIQAGFTLKNGRLLIDEAVFDGSCAKMVGTGEIELESQKVNITVLVSPLRTVEQVIGYIPLAERILGGSPLSIPVQVGGDLSNPTVTAVSPSAVASGLFDSMKKAFRLPFMLRQPLQ